MQQVEYMESIKHTLTMLSTVTIEILFLKAEFSANVLWTYPSYLLTCLVINWLCHGVCTQS